MSVTYFHAGTKLPLPLRMFLKDKVSHIHRFLEEIGAITHGYGVVLSVDIDHIYRLAESQPGTAPL